MFFGFILRFFGVNMNGFAIKFQEDYTAVIPALSLLANLGWEYINETKALDARENNLHSVILKTELKKQLKKRSFLHEGKRYPLSDKSIDKIISILSTPKLDIGLTKANENIYDHLIYGINVTEVIGGKKVPTTVPIIDWHHIDNNSFLYTEEFSVFRSNGYDKRRPDIICFVNGLPVVVIEAKRPDGKNSPTVDEGISQSLRNQRSDEIPQLFAYTQLLLSISGVSGRYGTCMTPKKFWAAWREEELSDLEMAKLKNSQLSVATKSEIFAKRSKSDLVWYENLIASGELAITEQDKLIIGLLSKNRLLDMIRLYSLFDSNTGRIVARYQQVFGIKELIKRISNKKSDGSRNGGVIWHTTGSGKSYTMVLLCRALLMLEGFKAFRFVVVTDRKDLESQLGDTFIAGDAITSAKKKISFKASSGRQLAQKVGQGNQRIIFSLVQKFNSAIKYPECHNDSSELLVLVDEGHRTHGGESHIRMRQALPNAAFIAFTGTPLLKDDKTTEKFGSIIHSYTMQRAVEDGTVTPLLYEERKPILDVHSKAIDLQFERIMKGLNEKQILDFKKKFTRKGQVYSADDRIRLIAYDIATHFNENIIDGLKGQIACDSKLSAIKYKQYLDEIGFFESAIVISAPDSREGNTDVDESTVPEVTKWWNTNVGTQSEEKYTESIVKRFETDPKLKILIVVDKLLTGFDEPQNAVLYIDKSLKQHNLIQAIARVNRLHPLKKFGLLIDYRGILAELDTTIRKYRDLANRTQGGYDINDLEGLYSQMNTEYKRLPQLYQKLWQIFDGVKNKQDYEQLRRALVPNTELREGELIDLNQKKRDDFLEALTEFASCLKVALQSATFFEDTAFTDEERNLYKQTLKDFTSLRQMILRDIGETIDFDEYEHQIKKILDRNVIGVEVNDSEEIIDISKAGTHIPENWSDEKTRNETDIIRTRVTRMIEQDLRDDPYAQEAFSKLLKASIEEAEKMFEYPLKQYYLFNELAKKVESRKVDDIPETLNVNKHAQAYYGICKKTLPEAFINMKDEQQKYWVDLAFNIDKVVEQSVVENSLNTANIEDDIRRNLLPTIFKSCKSVGAGIDQAKIIVESVVQITRVGLNQFVSS